MKHFFTLMSVFLFIGMLAPTQQAQACVDPDSTVIIDVCYDTVNLPVIDEMYMRISNMRLMNEAPNTICSCALTYYNDFFTDIQYIAFVDSGTNTPYEGFAGFNNSLNVDQAWNTSPGGTWAGYIADVINSGLQANDPVELIIRVSAPAGVQYTVYGDSIQGYESLYDDVVNNSLGTDAWDPIAQELVNDHLSVKSFAPWAQPGNSLSFTPISMTEFTQLDNDILNNIATVPSLNMSVGRVTTYPNPFAQTLTISVDLQESNTVRMEVYSVSGKLLWKKELASFAKGEHLFELNAAELNMTQGLYFIKVQVGEEQQTMTVVHR